MGHPGLAVFQVPKIWSSFWVPCSRNRVCIWISELSRSNSPHVTCKTIACFILEVDGGEAIELVCVSGPLSN